MKNQFKDKNGRKITEPGVIEFSIKDEMEPSGFCTWKANVKIFQGMLGYYSENEKRVIPFLESYPDGVVNDAEVI